MPAPEPNTMWIEETPKGGLTGYFLARLGATRSASNLNQIAKAINQGTLYVDDELAADLTQACAEVAWMRVTLMQALGIES